MNPYLIYIELGVAALVLTLAAAAGYHFGGLSARNALATDHAAMAQAATEALLAQRASAQAQAINDNAAETHHAQTIIQIDAAPAIRTPVLVYGPGPVCPGSLPGAEAKASGVPADPAAGRGQPVDRGRDIRPAIEALKKRLERIMADYRQEDAEWTTK